MYQATLKVLALMSRLVTSPLWRLLESDLHMLEMNENYRKLVEYLNEQAEDPAKFLRGVVAPFGMDSVNRDAFFPVFCEPLPSEELESLSYKVAKLALAGVSHLLKRMLADQLPGCEFWGKEHDSEMRKETLSVPKTNKAPERIFGMLDSAFTRKPNISILTAEALILYTKDKTANWLESKRQDEKDQLFVDFKRQSKRIRAEWKQRREEVRQMRLKKLQEKQDKIVLTERRRIQRKEKWTIDIVNDGLLQSRDTIHENVLSDCVSESAKVQLLKKQLTFRRDVLGQKAPTGNKNAFRFSCKIGPGPKDVHKLNWKPIFFPFQMMRQVTALMPIHRQAVPS